MAGRGRGRGATLPAWMTADGAGGGVNIAETSTSFSISSRGGDIAGDDGHDRDRRKRSRSRSREDRRYSRDRSKDRSRDVSKDHDRGRNYRDRSKSNERANNNNNGGGGGGGGWRPGRKKGSNFDVAPLPGEEEPPSILGFVQPPGGSGHGYSSGGGAGDTFTKHARKLYIGNLPANTTEDHIRDFFHDVISNCIPPGDIDPFQNHIIQVLNHMDKGFAFVEFSSIELTAALLLIDGAKYNFRNGSTLIRIRRPNDYKENMVPASTRPPIQLCNLEYLGISPNVEGNKLFIANIPYQLTDEEVRTLLIVPGELKAFHLVREPGQLNHKGYGFAEYVDKPTAERAKLILTNIDFQGKKLTITDASSKVTGSQNPLKVNYGAQSQQQAHPMNAANLTQPTAGGQYGGSSYGSTANSSASYGSSNSYSGTSNYGSSNNYGNSNNYGSSNNYGDNYSDTGNYNNSSNYDSYQSYPPSNYKVPFDQLPPTCVIKLVNMVTKEELEDDQEYFDIIEDVRAECSEYGHVVSVLIPRMKDRFPEHTQGSIYVQFRDKNHSKNAAVALSGRKFAERTVVVEYSDETQFLNRNF